MNDETEERKEEAVIKMWKPRTAAVATAVRFLCNYRIAALREISRPPPVLWKTMNAFFFFQFAPRPSSAAVFLNLSFRPEVASHVKTSLPV